MTSFLPQPIFECERFPSKLVIGEAIQAFHGYWMEFVFAGVRYMESLGFFYCITFSQPSLYCIFLLMEGLRFGWDILLFGRDSSGKVIILMSLIEYFIHLHKVSGINTQWLYVKVTFTEQTMTVSPLYWCMTLNADDFDILMVHLWL